MELGLPEVGRSSLGRPVYAGQIADGTGRPVLVVAGVHGNEPASVEAVLALCANLRGRSAGPQGGSGSATQGSSGPGRRAVWVMPAMNPDGVLANTKDSARGVDLNRNFPARSFTVEHRPGYFPGPAPLSEPESRALAALVDALDPEGVVAVHAPFACVNYDGPAARWAAEVSAASGWPVREDIGYPTPGSLGSWLGRDRDVPVLTLELPPGAYAHFRAPAQAALQTAINCGRIR